MIYTEKKHILTYLDLFPITIFEFRVGVYKYDIYSFHYFLSYLSRGARASEVYDGLFLDLWSSVVALLQTYIEFKDIICSFLIRR